MSHFEVFVRPMGGVKLAGACCSDDRVHFFVVQPEVDEVSEVPVCEQTVQAARTSQDSDAICETCMVAGMSWAQGGTLKVSAV